MQTEPTLQSFTARCSFCKKQPEEVAILISGPGVYICDGCVAIAQGVVETHKPTERKVLFDPAAHFRGMESSFLLKLVGDIEPVHHDVAAQEQLIVSILRERDVSWAEIGVALGVSRQAAWRRFASGPETE